MPKSVSVTLALIVSLVIGHVLSGWLVLLLLRLDTGHLAWNTYFTYIAALGHPQVAAHATRIGLAGVLGFGLPLALLITVGYAGWRRGRRQALHGDARFATGSELARHGLFEKSSDSLVVGSHRGRLLRLSGQQFAILAAPTRSGKGVGVVIPNLLEYGESMVVLDIKQENFDLTSGWRASQGQEVYLFNPFAEDRRTHRWNPLRYVSEDPSFRISDLLSISAMLYPDGGDDQKFWVSQSRNAFLAITLYLFENRDNEYRMGFPREKDAPTLGQAFRLACGDGSDLRVFLRKLASRPFVGSDCRAAFNNLLSQADDTFASIMGTFKEPLNAWINPVLDAATSDDDFLLTDLRRKKMTIYVGIQPDKLAESRLIINLFFSQLINLNTRQLPDSNPELKHQVLLLMDEFTSIGKVEIIASAVSYMAGYNVRLLPIIQSMAQLDATYGKDVSRTILTNHALQILYAPREQQDANDYSEMLGYTTLRRKNVTQGRDRSHSFSDERRALMLPQELKAMGDDTEVFIYEGLPFPVKCRKIRYYKDRYFTSRLLQKIDVPALDITVGDARPA